jgi:hypothetical protein
MSEGSSTSFTSDRFGHVNSALALNGGYTQVPAGYYFNTPQFSISLWAYPSQVVSWARIFDFCIEANNELVNVILKTLELLHKVVYIVKIV